MKKRLRNNILVISIVVLSFGLAAFIYYELKKPVPEFVCTNTPNEVHCLLSTINGQIPPTLQNVPERQTIVQVNKCPELYLVSFSTTTMSPELAVSQILWRNDVVAVPKSTGLPVGISEKNWEMVNSAYFDVLIDPCKNK